MRRDQLYEYYCCDHLVQDHGYQYAWTWRNIPENKLLDAKLINRYERLRLERKRLRGQNQNPNPLQDYGIDLLAEENGNYLVGQSKCYSNENTVNRNELAGFFEYLSMPKLQKHIFKVFYTTKLCPRLTENVTSDTYATNLQFVKLEMPTDYTISQPSVPDLTTIIATNREITLRNYQLDALEQLKNHFLTESQIEIDKTNNYSTELSENIEIMSSSISDNDDIETTNDHSADYYDDPIIENRKVGILSMPGGLGKTEIFLTFAKNNYQYCVILSPTRALANQTLERATQSYPDHTYFKLVDSEGCRDIKSLTIEINQAKLSNKCIVISATFKSCDVIVELLELLSNSTNQLLLIVDEFHNIPKPAIVDNNHDMNKVLVQAQRILFVSATPRCYELECGEYDSLSPLTDTGYMFGEKIYEIPFKEAVTNGHICDYQLWLPSIWHTYDNENQLKSVGTDLALNIDGFQLIEKNRYLKMIVLVNWMLQVGLRRVIVYVLADRNSDVKSAEIECGLLSKIFVDICEKYHSVNYHFGTILGDTISGDRARSLHQFVNAPDDHLNVLFNCRVLDEGIDLPACDGIAILYGSENKVRNVQRLYRCLRKYREKTKGHCLYWGDDESKTASFLSSLAEFDEDYKTKIKIQSTDYGENLLVSDETRLKKTKQDQTELDQLIVKAIPYVDLWYHRLTELKKWIDVNHRRPSEKSKNEVEKRLGRWISNQLAHYKNKVRVLTDQAKRTVFEEFLATYQDFTVNYNDKWYNTLAELKKWIDVNHRRPIRRSENEAEKVLGVWLGTQVVNYKNKDAALRNQAKRTDFEEFLATYRDFMVNNDDKWYSTLAELKKWIDVNHRRPMRSSEKSLGIWITTQLTNYKNKKEALTDEAKRVEWRDFVISNQRLFKKTTLETYTI